MCLVGIWVVVQSRISPWQRDVVVLELVPKMQPSMRCSGIGKIGTIQGSMGWASGRVGGLMSNYLQGHLFGSRSNKNILPPAGGFAEHVLSSALPIQRQHDEHAPAPGRTSRAVADPAPSLGRGLTRLTRAAARG